MADTITESVYISGNISYVTGTVNGAAYTWTMTGDHIWSASGVPRSADGAYVIALTAIDTAGNQLSATTTGYEGLHLKTDWTAKDYYNAKDLNRVGAAVAYIAAQLQAAGYACEVSPTMTWTDQGYPTPSAMQDYLAQVRTVKAAFYGTGALPDSMAYLTADGANAIEKLLEEIETYYTNMVKGTVWLCGVSAAGDHLL